MPVAVQLDSGVSYTPPPNEPANAGAEFIHNFLRMRTPWAMDVFRARLNALDPDSQYEFIAKLEAERARLLDAAAANERSVRSAQSAADTAEKTVVGKYIDLQTAAVERDGRIAAEKIGASSRDVVSRRDQQTELLKAQQLTTDAGQGLAQAAGRQIAAVERQLREADAAGDDAGIATALEEYEKAITQIQADAQFLKPTERDALNNDIQRRMSELRLEPVLGGEVTRITAPRFPKAGRVPIEEMSPEMFGPGRVPSPEQIGGGARAALEAYGLTPAQNVPSSSSSSRESARARVSSPGAPAATLPIVDDRGTGGGEETSPTPGPMSDEQIQEGIRHIDAVINEMKRRREADPFGGLGGFFDPLPASPKTSSRERVPGKAAASTGGRTTPRGAAALLPGPTELEESIAGARIGEGGKATRAEVFPGDELPEGRRPIGGPKRAAGLRPEQPTAEPAPAPTETTGLDALMKLMAGQELSEEELEELKRARKPRDSGPLLDPLE